MAFKLAELFVEFTTKNIDAGKAATDQLLIGI